MKSAASKIFSLLSAVVLFAGMAAAQSGRAQPKPTPTPDDDPVKVETEEVKLNLLAFDEDGKFFQGVTKEDVVITENNILHTAESLKRIPANVLIVMDTGGEDRSMKSLDGTRKVARALVSNLRPEDSVAILQYADKAVIASEWSTDREQISKAIGRTKFGIRSAFVDALNLARTFLTSGELENKHLVLITDGTDSYVDLSKKNAAMKSFLSTDIAVHVLSYAKMEAVAIEPRTKAISNSPPPPAMPDEIKATLPNGARDINQAPKIGPTINMDRTFLKKMKARKADLELSEEMLQTLAENTNGTDISPGSTDEMEAKTALVAKNIDASYVLTYIPKVSFAENGGERKIEVTSKRAGLVVQAKRKFTVPPKR
ncbi:MAG: VWA domain-containing protein [Pyrinomonadaceae bacterium]